VLENARRLSVFLEERQIKWLLVQGGVGEGIRKLINEAIG
jgi:hypothetical protein